MTRPERVKVAHPKDDALDTLTTLSTNNVNQLPVIEQEHVRDLIRAFTHRYRYRCRHLHCRAAEVGTTTALIGSHA
jgi:hypothetical protein